MKLLSEASEYGLRAVVWLALHPAEPQKARVIAEEIRASPGYLVKVLQELAKVGILSARRGSQGGFALNCDPAKLTALDVIEAIDPFERIDACPLAMDAHATHLCPIHRRVDQAMDLIETRFRELTIQDVMASQDDSASMCEMFTAQGCIAARGGSNEETSGER